jgi:hypothetical protein|tara:strand:- start:817 stop:987 length:171 start_codon:yes stop_codon:yes gene_type:complete
MLQIRLKPSLLLASSELTWVWVVISFGITFSYRKFIHFNNKNAQLGGGINAKKIKS